jgi:hypothetical protein
MFFFEFI